MQQHFTRWFSRQSTDASKTAATEADHAPQVLDAEQLALVSGGIGEVPAPPAPVDGPNGGW